MQDEVNQDYSEQNEVDGMKKGADNYPSVLSFCICILGLEPYFHNDVASCEVNGCFYVSDSDDRCIDRFDLLTSERNAVRFVSNGKL